MKTPSKLAKKAFKLRSHEHKVSYRDLPVFSWTVESSSALSEAFKKWAEYIKAGPQVPKEILDKIPKSPPKNLARGTRVKLSKVFFRMLKAYEDSFYPISVGDDTVEHVDANTPVEFTQTVSFDRDKYNSMRYLDTSLEPNQIVLNGHVGYLEEHVVGGKVVGFNVVDKPSQ